MEAHLTPRRFLRPDGTYPPLAGADGSTDGPQPRLNLEECNARLEEIRSRIEEMDREADGTTFSAEQEREWHDLLDERKVVTQLRDQLKVRADTVAAVAEEEGRSELTTPNIPRPGAVRGDNIWDLTTVRMSAHNPEAAARELTDRAMRAIEKVDYPHAEAEPAHVREHISRLLSRDNDHGDIARHLLVTGSPLYTRAFSKEMLGRRLTSDEQDALSRALSLTGASGGFAIPFMLDPTIVPTSNGSVNPYRRIARVEQGTTDDWKGVTSAGITAAYGAEVTEASDDAPTLAQPTVSSEKCQAFVPYSIEVGMDWPALAPEMAQLFQDAKDDVEASKFSTGSGTNEPFGVVTGATTLTTSAGSAAFAVADVYALETALGPRFRSRAQFLANRAVYQRVRQFDTSGGASLWMQLERGLNNDVPAGGNTGAQLIGYPANEVSGMSASPVTSGQKTLILGDFRYFLIYERIGMTVEQIPHLMGASGRPTGQRGLYAYWRNGSKVLHANAFRTLIIA